MVCETCPWSLRFPKCRSRKELSKCSSDSCPVYEIVFYMGPSPGPDTHGLGPIGRVRRIPVTPVSSRTLCPLVFPPSFISSPFFPTADVSLRPNLPVLLDLRYSSTGPSSPKDIASFSLLPSSSFLIKSQISFCVYQFSWVFVMYTLDRHINSSPT